MRTNADLGASLVVWIGAGLLVQALYPSCTNTSDPGPNVAPDTDLCGRACANLQRLGCPEGEPLISTDADGGTVQVSCEQFCIETQNTGVPLNTRCISKVKSCEEAHRCDSATACCLLNE